MIRPLACVLLLAFGLLGGDGPVAVSEPTQVVIRLPLKAGRLEVRPLLESVCREAGIDPSSLLGDLDWTIDVGSSLSATLLASRTSASVSAPST